MRGRRTTAGGRRRGRTAGASETDAAEAPLGSPYPVSGTGGSRCLPVAASVPRAKEGGSSTIGALQLRVHNLGEPRGESPAAVSKQTPRARRRGPGPAASTKRPCAATSAQAAWPPRARRLALRLGARGRDARACSEARAAFRDASRSRICCWASSTSPSSAEIWSAWSRLRLDSASLAFCSRSSARPSLNSCARPRRGLYQSSRRRRLLPRPRSAS